MRRRSALRELDGRTLDQARAARQRLLDDAPDLGSDLRGEDGPADELVSLSDQCFMSL